MGVWEVMDRNPQISTTKGDKLETPGKKVTHESPVERILRTVFIFPFLSHHTLKEEFKLQ